MNTEFDKNSERDTNPLPVSDQPEPVIRVNLGRFAIWREDRNMWLAGLVGGCGFFAVVLLLGWLSLSQVVYYALLNESSTAVSAIIMVFSGVAVLASVILFPIAFLIRSRSRALAGGIVSALILGIVATGAWGSWYATSVYRAERRATKITEDSRRITDIQQLVLALEIYFDTNDSYPMNLAELQPEHIPTVPKDPDGSEYLYFYCSPTSYHIGASLMYSNTEAGYDQTAYDSDKDAVCEGDPIRGSDAAGCRGESGRYCYDAAESSSDIPADAEVRPATIRLISPNGGENLCLGQKYAIRWEGANGLRTVSLFVHEVGDATLGDKIGIYPATFNEENAPGMGTVVWTVGTVSDNTSKWYDYDGYTYEVSVEDTDNSWNYDISDGVFSIQQCKG